MKVWILELTSWSYESWILPLVFATKELADEYANQKYSNVREFISKEVEIIIKN